MKLNKGRFIYSSPLLAMIFMSGCASLPNDAPRVFTDARESLEEVDSRDIEDHFPNTVSRAEKKFDHAIDTYEDGVDEDSASKRNLATSEATEVLKTANGLLKLDSEMQNWDTSASAFDDIIARLDDGSKIETSAFAKLRNSEVQADVAFFDTGKSDEPVYNSKALDSLANILKKDESFRVVLTGHADQRGPEDLNERLGLQRAKKVADDLASRGVSKSQITYKSMGEDHAMGKSAIRYQLDRKVAASLTL